MGRLIVAALLTLMTFCGPAGALYDEEPLVWPPYRTLLQARTSCPCSDASLCKPITTVPKYEVFAFMTAATNYKKYDWSRITTVILFSKAMSDEVMCYAHSKGVRVSYGADFPVNNLTDSELRSAWVQQQVMHARANFYDGINLDFEDSITETDVAKRTALNSLVTELTKAFKATFSNPQVTFDTPYSPVHTARHFDYLHIATTMDFLLIMAYDESEICNAGPNCDLYRTTTGVGEFMRLGIPSNKLVLGLPWYGYDYPCATISVDNVCEVSPHCGGEQVSYSGIMSLLKTSTSGRMFHNTSASVYFNHKDAKGGWRQAWYDDKQTLGLKYKWAATNHLRGVGMWHADCLDYSDTPEGVQERRDMWGSLPVVNTWRDVKKILQKGTENDVL